jgi:hypothetical protein
MSRHALAGLCLACLCCAAGAGVGAATASADVFGPISLLSASPVEQFEYAHDADVSGDGRYVVFDGSIGGVSGVWRRENRPGGALEQVAGGNSELPSVSENGQYVAFTTDEGTKLEEATNEQPVAHPAAGAPNVYVRNMSVRPGEGAFTLASNVTYEYPAGERELDERIYGSEANGRTAISADGTKVVFVTTAPSNLAGPGTPPLEVGLHDMTTGATELVSVAYDPETGGPAINAETGKPEPVPYEAGGEKAGAVYAPGGQPPQYARPEPFRLPRNVGASISADGSTVAWMGMQIGRQAPLLSEERLPPHYSEPLWRRVDDGPLAPTRRVTGGSDPANPACADHAPIAPGGANPCRGPFTASGGYGIWNGDSASDLVQLSANGELAAFLATAPLVSQGEDFGTATASRPPDLYVSSMREGTSRDQALTQLTEVAGAESGKISTDAEILDFAISPEGTQVAFTTRRTVFPLSSPAFSSAPAAVPGMAELFDVDLPRETLTRVTHGYRGEASERPHPEGFSAEDPYGHVVDGALSPSFSSDGDTLVFTSTAANLVYGDGNTPGEQSELDGSDVFAVERLTFSQSPAPQLISEAPPGPSLQPLWRLSVTARSLSDGDVELYVSEPGPGRLSAQATGSVPVASPGARRASRGRPRRGHVTRTLARSLASAAASGDVADGETAALLLAPAARYRSLSEQRYGLSAGVRLTFTAPGHPTLHASIAVTFRRSTAGKHAARSASRRASRRRAG